MKKIKFLLVALLLPISLLAQIKLAEEKIPKEEKPFWWSEREAINAPYDSLYYKIEVYPILDAYKKYIGQRLYLPSNERLSDSYKLNYPAPHILFSNKIDTTIIIRGYYEPNDTLPIYLYKYRDAKNNINIVGNKYYEIIDVLSIEKSVEFEKHSIYDSKMHRDVRMYQTPGNSGNEDFKMFLPGEEEGGAPYFVLREIESGDTVYTGFPREFILVGGFVKLQQEFIGHNIFEVKNKPSKDFVLHEQSYENLIKNKFKCVDVVLNKKGSVDLVLKNIDDTTEVTEIALSDLIKSIDDVSWSWKWVTEKIYNEAWDILLAENAVKEKEKREAELQREKENQQYRQQRAQQKAKRKQELTTKYGATIADKIIAGKFEIGMSKSVCAEIAGYATIADKTSTTETWKISNVFFGGVTYLFFVNDKLVRIVNP